MLFALLLCLVVAVGQAAETFGTHTFYFGDPHAHTGVSGDGSALEYNNCRTPVVCGSMAAVFDTARANGLDFVALTDHNNNVTSAADFNALLARVRAENSPTFVTIPGTEVSSLLTRNGPRYGHKSLYVWQDDDSRLANLSLANFPTPTIATGACAVDTYSTAAAVAAQFGPTLFWAHHPTATGVATTNWACHNQTYEPVVEVYSGWGNALTLNPDYDAPLPTDVSSLDAPADQATIHAALQTFGLKVGFVAGTDLHDTRPGMTCDRAADGVTAHAYGGGLTMVVLDQGAPFTRSAIYGELVARRTLATTGPRVPVEVTWTTSDGVPHRIGEELTVTSGLNTMLTVKVPAAYDASVTGVSAIGFSTTIPLAKTGPGSWSVTIANAALPSWLYVAVAINGTIFYGATVCDDGGSDTREFVWSSPEWFTVTAPPPTDVDGDGYTPPADCDDTRSSVHPGAAEVCDGLDNDCDGGVDVGATNQTAYYTDGDGDGFGAGTATLSCTPIAGKVTNGTDCNDLRPRIYPGATDRLGDGIDQNCDGHDG